MKGEKSANVPDSESPPHFMASKSKLGLRRAGSVQDQKPVAKLANLPASRSFEAQMLANILAADESGKNRRLSKRRDFLL